MRLSLKDIFKYISQWLLLLISNNKFKNLLNIWNVLKQTYKWTSFCKVWKKCYCNQLPSHCVKSVCIRSYSVRIFPRGKIRNSITPNTDTFYAVSCFRDFFLDQWNQVNFLCVKSVLIRSFFEVNLRVKSNAAKCTPEKIIIQQIFKQCFSYKFEIVLRLFQFFLESSWMTAWNRRYAYSEA